MGHIYCNKATGVRANTTLSATLLAPPTRLVLPDSFITCFHGNSLSTGSDSLMLNSKLALMETEAGSLHDVFMRTGMAMIFFLYFFYV